VIQRDKTPAPSDPRFDGFYAPYASRIEAFDACFGQFIQDLKTLGLFNQSIIIFTSDHGDSLGENDRWGHAYTIYPEILRVPLIFHVPDSLRRAYVAHPDAPAFLIDITPTLYTLLGWNIRADNPVLGRPLVAKDDSTLQTGQLNERMVVSSYGPVYGILSPEGERLYIADAINYTSYLIDLRAALNVPPTLASASVARDYNADIRRHIEDLNAFFR